MNIALGSTRTVVKPNYALLSPDGFVPSTVPGWRNVVVNVLISPAMGAQFSQSLITFSKGGHGQGETGDRQLFLYVVSGRIALNKRALGPGGFAWLPPHSRYNVVGTKARVLVLEKHYTALAGTK